MYAETCSILSALLSAAPATCAIASASSVLAGSGVRSFRTSDIVRTVLSGLSENDLNTDFPELPGGLRVPSGLFLLHLSTHLAFHLGQAGYLRRLLTGENPQSSGAMAIRALAAEPPASV